MELQRNRSDTSVFLHQEHKQKSFVRSDSPAPAVGQTQQSRSTPAQTDDLLPPPVGYSEQDRPHQQHRRHHCPHKHHRHITGNNGPANNDVGAKSNRVSPIEPVSETAPAAVIPTEYAKISNNNIVRRPSERVTPPEVPRPNKENSKQGPSVSDLWPGRWGGAYNIRVYTIMYVVYYMLTWLDVISEASNFKRSIH
jgi:hypothetical protein